jgi:cell division protein FtsB
MFKQYFWLIVFGVFLLFIFVPSYSQKRDLNRRNEEYRQKIVELKEENLALHEEKRRLEDDPVYLEKVAREKMGLAKEGEMIMKMDNTENSKP